MSCRLNKQQCIENPECKWIVGRGCRKSAGRGRGGHRGGHRGGRGGHQPCYKFRKNACVGPNCMWVKGRGCKTNYDHVPEYDHDIHDLLDLEPPPSYHTESPYENPPNYPPPHDEDDEKLPNPPSYHRRRPKKPKKSRE